MKYSLRHKRRTAIRDGVTLYQCSICKNFFPRKNYHKDKKRKFEVGSACKQCFKNRYYLKIPITTKTCNICLKEKSLKYFGFRGVSKKSGRTIYQYRCKSCGTKMRKTPNYQYLSYKRGAEKRGLSFLLSREFFHKINKQPCHYCGRIPNENQCSGIDRIDNLKGYFKNNCVPCCKICNYAKRNMNSEEYINHCKKVAIWRRRISKESEE